jgi:hypothetical protein
VIAARRLQRHFADGFIAEAVEDLWEPWMRHADQPRKSGLVAGGYAIVNPTGLVPKLLVRGKARTTASRIRRHRAIGFNCSAVDLM